MFGHHKIKREKRRLKEQETVFNKQKKDYEDNAPARQKEASDFKNKTVSEKVKEAQERRKTSYDTGIKQGEELFAKDVQGLDPEKRKSLQYEANANINRNMQTANRQLLGEQSQRGIVGKGGVGYAQQRALQQMAQDAQRGVTRDLTNLDQDLIMKKKASLFATGQGEATQGALDQQIASDEYDLGEEKKRQQAQEDEFNRQYNPKSYSKKSNTQFNRV